MGKVNINYSEIELKALPSWIAEPAIAIAIAGASRHSDRILNYLLLTTFKLNLTQFGFLFLKIVRFICPSSFTAITLRGSLHLTSLLEMITSKLKNILYEQYGFF